MAGVKAGKGSALRRAYMMILFHSDIKLSIADDVMKMINFIPEKNLHQTDIMLAFKESPDYKKKKTVSSAEELLAFFERLENKLEDSGCKRSIIAANLNYGCAGFLRTAIADFCQNFFNEKYPTYRMTSLVEYDLVRAILDVLVETANKPDQTEEFALPITTFITEVQFYQRFSIDYLLYGLLRLY